MRSLHCQACGKQFKTKRSYKLYCSSKCQISYSRQQDWEKKKVTPYNRCQALLSGAKNRSKTKNLSFDLDHEYLYNLWLEQDGRCQVTNEEFDLRRPEEGFSCRWNAPSLDRINPSKGYIKGNVRLVCYQINAAIGEFGLEHFLELCKKVEHCG